MFPNVHSEEKVNQFFRHLRLFFRQYTTFVSLSSTSMEGISISSFSLSHVSDYWRREKTETEGPAMTSTTHSERISKNFPSQQIGEG